MEAKEFIKPLNWLNTFDTGLYEDKIKFDEGIICYATVVSKFRRFVFEVRKMDDNAFITLMFINKSLFFIGQTSSIREAKELAEKWWVEFVSDFLIKNNV